MFKKSWKILLLSAALFGSGCSLLVDLDECETNADCSEKFGGASTCQEGVCEISSLTSDNCKISLGNPGAPDTLTIGVILALSGDQSGNGNPRKNAIEVAYNDLEKIKIDGSDLAILFCDDKSTLEGAIASAKHLAEVVKVPAIIGPQFSDQVKVILEDVTRASKTALILPSATAALISTLDDDNLVWRTAPSDTFQAESVAKLLGATKDALVAASKPADKIWVLTAGDGIYAGGLRDGLTQNFPTSIDPANVENLNYPEENFGAWVSENLANLPDPNIVVILGFAEAWDLANTIDDFSESDPIFIFVDGAKNQKQAKAAPNLARRVLGTAPQNVGDNSYTPYTVFRAKYESAGFKDSAETQFLPHAYDALYLVALAAGANGFSGPNIAKGMERLSKGENIDPTRTGVEKAFSILREDSKATVDYGGASGKVDFDKNGDPSRNPISLWCFDGSTIKDENVLLDADNVFTFDSATIFSENGCLEPLVE